MDDRGPVSELEVGSTRVARLMGRGTMLILGALALCTAVPAMASAASPGWVLNELPLTESSTTAWAGKLKVTDSNVPLIGSESLECETTAAGTAGVPNVGKVTSWKSSKCAAGTGCEKSTVEREPTIVALHLPWNTELVTVEGQPREVAVNGGSGTPGFEVICWELGTRTHDPCLGTINLTTKNVTGGVSGTFGAGEKLKCEQGTNSGSLEGTQSIKASAGGTLHTAGNVSLGWMDNGSPITEKKTAAFHGAITLSDNYPSLGSISVRCEDTGKGTVGSGVSGEVTSWTLSNCVPEKTCESTSSIEAVNLPWHTELATVEGALNDVFKTTENGFRMKCKVGSLNITDTCPVVPHASMTNTEHNYVLMAFSGEKFTCTGSKAGTGELEGSQTVELSVGGDLWGA
jgi:hypothetical protein